MLHTGQDLAFRRTIASQFIRNDHARDILQFFQERGAKNRSAAFLLRRLCDPYIEYVAILIYCSPQIMLLAFDRKENARPYAICPHSEGDDGAVHWRRSAQTRKHHCRTVS
jgi:hypothetical protein